MKLVTSEEMRRLEQAAVEAGTSEAQLMEEAGLAVAQECWMLLGSLEGRRIAVLAGPGNNGGDGLVAARHLSEWGAEVVVFAPLGRAADDNLQQLQERDVAIIESPPAEAQFLGDADLVIDALLGIGHSRSIDAGSALGESLAALAAARRRSPAPRVVAVDLPSGLDADTGEVDPLSVEPDVTVTFGLPKVGMYQAPGSGIVGKVQVIDIGIPAAAMDGVALELLTSRWMRGALPERPEGANKGTFGRVLVVGGSRRFAGAPLLAARGAYRAGAGLVTIACPQPLYEMAAAQVLESTWLPLEATAEGGIADINAPGIRNEWPQFAAAVVGPGMGDTEATRAFLWASLPDLAEMERGFVLDADALNALASMDDARDRVPPNAILTPHPGEMARLLSTSVADVQARRSEVALEAARAFGCTVVLKGAHSVIAGADGKTRLSPFANPLLASAGTGDVLAGVIGAYLGQGLAPFDAAALGVYVHGAAGESIRQRYGDAGLLASDLANEIPLALHELRG